MLKKIFEVIKRIVIGVLIIYGYNLIAAPLNLIIPINIITVLLVTVLGTPALFSLIVIFLLVF